MDEERKEQYGVIEMNMTNDAETNAGSHDIMAGIMAAFGKLENADMVIIGFEGKFTFRERNADEARRVDLETLESGTDDVQIDVNTTDLEKMQRWASIENQYERNLYVMCDRYTQRDPWMTEDEWREFCHNFRVLYRLRYELDDDEMMLFDSCGEVGIMDVIEVNDCLRKQGIPYRARKRKPDGMYRINYMNDL